MRGTFCIAAILLAGQPVVPDSPEQDGAPDPEFLEFLGETADFNPESSDSWTRARQSAR